MHPETQTRAKKLAAVVAEDAANNPHERGGLAWAARTQDYWTEKCGLTLRTFQRLINSPPFATEQAVVDGVKLALLRVLAPGEQPKKTPQRVANELRKIWLNRKIDHVAVTAKAEAGKPMKTEELLEDGRLKMTKHEHGCLIGLAEVWPDGKQHAILKCVLNNWPTFMVGVKLKLAVEQDAAHEGPLPSAEEQWPPIEGALFLKYPHLPTIRKFADVAVEVFQMDVQMHGKKKAA